MFPDPNQDTFAVVIPVYNHEGRVRVFARLIIQRIFLPGSIRAKRCSRP